MGCWDHPISSTPTYCPIYSKWNLSHQKLTLVYGWEPVAAASGTLPSIFTTSWSYHISQWKWLLRYGKQKAHINWKEPVLHRFYLEGDVCIEYKDDNIGQLKTLAKTYMKQVCRKIKTGGAKATTHGERNGARLSPQDWHSMTPCQKQHFEVLHDGWKSKMAGCSWRTQHPVCFWNASIVHGGTKKRAHRSDGSGFGQLQFNYVRLVELMGLRVDKTTQPVNQMEIEWGKPRQWWREDWSRVPQELESMSQVSIAVGLRRAQTWEGKDSLILIGRTASVPKMNPEPNSLSWLEIRKMGANYLLWKCQHSWDPYSIEQRTLLKKEWVEWNRMNNYWAVLKV